MNVRSAQLAAHAPPDAAALVRGLAVFGNPDGARLTSLLEAIQWLHVPAGRRLFSTGDRPDGMYVIVRGRVRFFDDAESGPVLAAEAGEGVSFGEGSLLLGGSRSRSAVVVRDALLVRLPPEHFVALMATSPEMATWVARGMAARAAGRVQVPARSLAADTTIVVAHAVATESVRALAASLAAQTGVPIVEAGPGLVLVDGADPDLLAGAVRQADRVLFVVGSDSRPVPFDVRALLEPATDPLAAAQVELVLMHDAATALPMGTGPWLATGTYAAHHHVRAGHGADVARLARRLTDRAVALVFGGGGARGMAHIGVLKALEELGIPVDAIGGSSIGAIVGGQAAMGTSWDDIADTFRHQWSNWRLRLDLNVPTVSFSSGRHAHRILERTFGELWLEDLWREYFCTTVNLSRFRLDVHRRGPAVRWIQASASAPGLWPPVVDDLGELHLDGGQLNNIPTDVMRAQHRGPLIAVDVCAVQRSMTVPSGTEPPVGLRHLLRRRFRHRYPSLVDTINRLALVGSLHHQESAPSYADVYLTPDLNSIGFSGFSRVDEAVNIGYQAALAGLDGWSP